MKGHVHAREGNCAWNSEEAARGTTADRRESAIAGTNGSEFLVNLYRLVLNVEKARQISHYIAPGARFTNDLKQLNGENTTEIPESATFQAIR